MVAFSFFSIIVLDSVLLLKQSFLRYISSELQATSQGFPQQLLLLSYCRIVNMLDEATVCFNSSG